VVSNLTEAAPKTRLNPHQSRTKAAPKPLPPAQPAKVLLLKHTMQSNEIITA